jgi:cytochrome c oxidase subunit II
MKPRIAAIAALSGFATLTAAQGALAFEGLPQEWQILLPSAASPVMESMRDFNTYVHALLIPVVILVMGLLAWVMYRYRESANPVPSRITHNTPLELAWTIIPVLILVAIAIPSFRLLFYQYEFPKADVVVKVTGQQWLWSYEYPDEKVTFYSLPIADSDLKPGQHRLLSVDNEMVVPVNKVVQVLVTGADVIHEWMVPYFGVRAKAIPGRVNRTWFIATKPGTYFGECSELCGQGHPLMPIAVKAVSEDEYEKWLADKKKQSQAKAQTGRTALASADAAFGTKN